MKIRFFDVSIDQGLKAYNNKLIGINFLINLKRKQSSEVFKKNKDLLQKIDPFNCDEVKEVLLKEISQFDCYEAEETAYWKKAIKTIMYCLSGQVPSRHEVLSAGHIICGLPKWFRDKYVDSRFMVGFLSYFVIGFRIYIKDVFRPEYNYVGDACKFIVYLFENKSVEMESYLCAHKAKMPRGHYNLVDKIRTDKAIKTLGLQKAIITNVGHLENSKIIWNQQGPTEMVSSNMFPEMFIFYMKNGEVPDLLILLEKHSKELEGFLNREETESIKLNIQCLDSFTKKIHAFLEGEFGKDWKTQDFKIDSFKGEKKLILDIAYSQALPEVRRLIPFCSRDQFDDFLKTKEGFVKLNMKKAEQFKTRKFLAQKTKKAIDWFYSYQLIKEKNKALYETIFYYTWGKLVSLSPNKIAFGIDRDYGEHQKTAFNLGYNSFGKDKKLSILYARRAPEEINGGFLRNISFRQFWRRKTWKN